MADDLDDVGRMAAARAFGVKGVDGAALDGGEGVFDKAAFVQRVGVDHHLHVHRRRPPTGSSRWRRGWCPNLRAVSARRPRRGPFRPAPRGGEALPLPDRPKLIGKASSACSIRAMMPRAGGAGGGQRAMRGAGAAAQHGGDAGMQRILDLLGAMKWIWAVKAACGQDLALARDDLGCRGR